MFRVCIPFLVFSLLNGSLFSDARIRFESVVSMLDRPLFLTGAGDESGRLFVLEQPGRIQIVREGQVLSRPFLDISGTVSFGGERGLLGLAFHPNFPTNGRFFINYTRTNGGQLQTVVSEYRRSSGDPDLADPSSERVLLVFDQPFSNHNGGMLDFGPDGYLYISSGDGGSGGDPQGNAQNLSNLLGKILRIDVDRALPYAIPPDNPFVGIEGARDEIWAYGLRNPWRFSFDSATGRLFAGDVGQGDWEEIDLINRGENYGWNRMEGTHCYPIGTPTCEMEGLTLPIAEIEHPVSRSITGGYVYRGSQSTSLWGSYLFGDFGTGRVWALSEGTGGVWSRQELARTGYSISSFGQDDDGEIYLVDYRGEVFRLVFLWRELFAHAADGDLYGSRFRSRIVLVNNGNQLVEGHLRFYSSEGELQAVTIGGERRSEFPIAIQGRSSIVMETDGISDPLYVGWAEAVVDAQIFGTLQYKLVNTVGKPLAEAGIVSAAPAMRLTAAVDRDMATGVDTGIAIVNSALERVVVSIVVRDRDGQVVLTQQVEMNPGQHMAMFLSQLGTLPSSFSGTIVIDTTAPIVATLISTVDGIHSASLPLAQSLE